MILVLILNKLLNVLKTERAGRVLRQHVPNRDK